MKPVAYLTVRELGHSSLLAGGPPQLAYQPIRYSQYKMASIAPVTTNELSVIQAQSCVDLPADTAAKLIANPSAFYVNVHSEGHPDGAMRGQLAKV